MWPPSPSFLLQYLQSIPTEEQRFSYREGTWVRVSGKERGAAPSPARAAGPLPALPSRDFVLSGGAPFSQKEAGALGRGGAGCPRHQLSTPFTCWWCLHWGLHRLPAPSVKLRQAGLRQNLLPLGDGESHPRGGVSILGGRHAEGHRACRHVGAPGSGRTVRVLSCSVLRGASGLQALGCQLPPPHFLPGWASGVALTRASATPRPPEGCLLHPHSVARFINFENPSA